MPADEEERDLSNPSTVHQPSPSPAASQPAQNRGSGAQANQDAGIAPFEASNDGGVGSGAAAAISTTTAFRYNATLPQIETDVPALAPNPAVVTHHCRTPSDAGLRLQTDLTSITKEKPKLESPTTPSLAVESYEGQRSSGSNALPLTAHKSALRSVLSASSMASSHSLSPGSALSSPSLNALADITPLPSPLMTGDSPGPWKRATPRPDSSGSPSNAPREGPTSNPDPVSPVERKKGHQGLAPTPVDRLQINQQRNAASHARNRSVSEFVPEPMHNVRPRNVTISSTTYAPSDSASSAGTLMHREECLAAQRGLTAKPVTDTAAPLPTPPPSNRSVTESEDGEESKEEDDDPDIYSVRQGDRKRKRRWRRIRQLGQGTFSKVMLATSENLGGKSVVEESMLDPKQLVAVKVIQHGPAGGADEERVELSLKREIEIMQSVSHPSVVHLKAFELDDERALLVLSYCPGGDLFDLASTHRDLLRPPLVQRIFAELVDATRYLHSQYVVHRDIKLENVLLNVRPSEISSIPSFAQYPYSIVTLTDLGLSRRIPRPPASPLLTTRCGSEDYAAPELLLGQPYDGRTTDAWALGVLLYALLEGRLPFDPPPPGARPSNPRSRAAHRIARCEWMWWQFGDEDGVWDANAGRGWEGAREVVEGLLKKVSRGRLALDQAAKLEWVHQGIQVEGGLKMREDADVDAVVNKTDDSGEQ